MNILGIDHGTTRTKTATVNPAGQSESILNARGEPFTPSVVYVSENGDLMVGTDAFEQGYLNPNRLIRNYKLRLGHNENLLNNGQVFTPTDAAAAIIAAIKKNAEDALNIKVDQCVLTTPANFGDDGKQASIEACERNGVKVLKLVPEPTAAGLCYAIHKAGTTLYFMVYDFGGGTFDVSILRVDGSEILVLATEGVHQLGGNDINERLRDHVLDLAAAQLGERPNPEADPLFKLDLDTRIEATKVSLGTRPQVPVVLNWRGHNSVVTVAQAEFHQLIEPLVKQTLEAVDRALDAASLRKTEIQDVILVGGTSRLPFVQIAVEGYIGKPAKRDIDPDKAVAHGAAQACLTELSHQGKTATIRGQVIPSPDLFVRDVTAHAVGCCVIDANGPSRRMLHSVIIPKNTPIPCCKVDRFYLERDDQTRAQVEILQGEPNADREQCLSIGEILLENLPPEPKRSARIQVEYAIDGNGMVTATATDLVSGKKQTVSVDYKKGIKPKDKLPGI